MVKHYFLILQFPSKMTLTSKQIRWKIQYRRIIRTFQPEQQAWSGGWRSSDNPKDARDSGVLRFGFT